MPKSRVIPIPVLTLLALIHRIEEIWARPAHLDVTYRPEVRNRQLLRRRLRQEQIPNRRVGRVRKFFKLLESRLLLSPAPISPGPESVTRVRPEQCGSAFAHARRVALRREHGLP